MYKTTCTITENFYIGVHSTKDLKDDYMGSGLRLLRSIKKHGKENHVREILEFFETREEMMNRECEVVNDKLLENSFCMNLKRGGNGGDGMKNRSVESIREMSKKGAESKRNLWNTNNEWREKLSSTLSRILKERFKTRNNVGFSGKKHSTNSIEKMKNTRINSQKGNKNSQFGKCWIHNNFENKSIAKDSINEWIEKGWIKGRKMNF